MKLRLHYKVCPKLAEGIDQLSIPKKAMVPREKQHHEVEIMQKLHERSNWDRY